MRPNLKNETGKRLLDVHSNEEMKRLCGVVGGEREPEARNGYRAEGEI